MRRALPQTKMHHTWQSWAEALVAKLSNETENAFEMDPFPKASLPSAALPYRLIIVTDEVGGLVPAFNDGTNWRRVTDRAIVS